MSAVAEKAAEGVVVLPEKHFSRVDERSMPTLQPANASPMAMLAVAVQNGMDPATIKELMDLQERWEKAEALKAFNVAFAEFKAEAVQVVKNRTVDAGPLKDKKYAELFSVVNAVTPPLSAHGLSTSWKITKDEKDWIEVTCYLKHSLGHSESVSMGGPPDAGGAKSAIQARASTVSYLERYTLKAICGVAEQGDDKDGGATDLGLAEKVRADHLSAIEEAATMEALEKAYLKAIGAAKDAKDKPAIRDFAAAKDKRKEALAKKGGAK